MTKEYNEGPEAKEKFEETMRTIFQAPKPEKPDPKKVELNSSRKPKQDDKN